MLLSFIWRHVKLRAANKVNNKKACISLLKKIRLFCAAPHELIIGPILTFLGLKWPLKNGPWSYQEKIEVFKMLHCKKCNFYFNLPVSYARKIQIFSGVPEKFSKPTVALPLFVDLFIQIVDTSALRRRRTVSSIFVILQIKYWSVTLQAIRETASQK